MNFDHARFSTTFPWLFPVTVFVVGACVGRFLNRVIRRWPKEESIGSPGSSCGSGEPSTWHYRISPFSGLSGHARSCGRPFSFRDPFVELLTAGLFVACWLHFPEQPTAALCGAIFMSCLVAAAFIDLDHFIIPDALTLGLGTLGVVLSLTVPELHGQHGSHFLMDSLRSGAASLIGLLIGSGFVLWIGLLGEAVLKKEAMGFGDVKFVGAIGAFCGWQGAVFSILGGAAVAITWFAVAWLWEKISGKRAPIAPPSESPEGEPMPLGFGVQVPFGPMLAIAGGLYFLFFRSAGLMWREQLALLF